MPNEVLINQFTHTIIGQFELFTNIKEKGKIYHRDMSKRKRLKSVKVKISDDDRESLESLSGIDDGKIIRKKNKNKKPTQLAITCS